MRKPHRTVDQINVLVDDERRAIALRQCWAVDRAALRLVSNCASIDKDLDAEAKTAKVTVLAADARAAAREARESIDIPGDHRYEALIAEARGYLSRARVVFQSAMVERRNKAKPNGNLGGRPTMRWRDHELAEEFELQRKTHPDVTAKIRLCEFVAEADQFLDPVSKEPLLKPRTISNILAKLNAIPKK
jgi:hypothetical protein